MNFDVITVGGGLGGAALARTLALQGIKVLVLERETVFKDRVRGEGLLPWGVNEARDLGIYALLMGGCGYPVKLWTSHAWGKRPARDLVATTPRGSHCLNFYHPAMQEVMLQAAEDAGAEVRRGVTVSEVEPGQPPRAVLRSGKKRETVTAILVVGADGRNSRVRSWGGFEATRDPERLVVAGVLLERARAPHTSIHIFRDSSRGEGGLFFPLSENQVRTYFIYRKVGARRGLSGQSRVPDLIQACVRMGVPRDWLEQAQAGGPLAEFDGADTWIRHPYRQGVALIGDAASSNDPSWGNGLSLTLRDARVLAEELLGQEDWEVAGNNYARTHDHHFGVINSVTRWLAELLYEVGSEAEAVRQRVFPQMSTDRSRSLDYIALGPETPSDETARRRFFCEDLVGKELPDSDDPDDLGALEAPCH